MKKQITLMAALIFFAATVLAQPQVYHVGVAKTNVDVRTAVTALGQLTITTAVSGKAVVHFDGVCVSSAGDRIVLAASDAMTYGSNNANLTLRVKDADINRLPFSHTMVYDISSGSHTFYALGHNATQTGGTGIASVYGSLTVEFFPVTTSLASVASLDVNVTNQDLRPANVTLGQLTINPTVAGKVIVRFDGKVVAVPGDRIILAASNTTNWSPNDGAVGIEVNSDELNRQSFSHTRYYAVTPGANTFYAVGRNTVETGGTGIVSVYGMLTVEFFPDVAGEATVYHTGIANSNIDLRPALYTEGSIPVTIPTNGKVEVQFDGFCIASAGDRIVLAASDAASWGTDDGNTNLEVYDTDNDRISFSHTRVYDVTPGNKTFYAVARNYVETDGTGIASVYGSLTVKYFPDPPSSRQTEAFRANQISVYPNPAHSTISADLSRISGKVNTIEIKGIDGRTVLELPVLNTANYQADISGLDAGVYFFRVITDQGIGQARFVKY